MALQTIKTFLPKSHVPIEVDYIVLDDDTVEVQGIWLYNELTGSYDEPAESYIKGWVFDDIEQAINFAQRSE